MISLALLRDWNWLASWRLGSRVGDLKAFLCRGKVQLKLAPSAQISRPLAARTQIGLSLMGGASQKCAVTVISAAEGSRLTLDGVTIGRGATLSAGVGARLSIGPRSYVNDRSLIAASQDISIGQGCAISWGVTIIDDDGHGSGPSPFTAPVVIEDQVWIGCNATILKGVRIGAGSVVAAGAVVTRSCPPRSLLAGVPAKVIRSEVSWRNPEGA